MSSGWIKFEKALRDDPRVLRIARQLGNAGVTHERFKSAALVTLVLGGLTQLWCYADTHVRDGDVLDLGVDDIDEVVGIQGFCSMLPDDWLQVIDTEHVKLPGFLGHNGTEARKKALTQKRVARHRESVTPQRVSKKQTCNADALPDQTRPDQTKTEEKNTSASATPRQVDEPDWFSEFKAIYPPRAGDQGWRKALKAGQARITEGHLPGDLTDGARRYAEFCRTTQKIGTEFVKQAATFLGPDKPFLQSWQSPSTRADIRLAGNLTAAQEFMRRTDPQ